LEGEIAADDLCLAADGQVEALSCVFVQQETQLGFDLRDTSNVTVCVSRACVCGVSCSMG
jgi:hypothetical protein